MKTVKTIACNCLILAAFGGMRMAWQTMYPPKPVINPDPAKSLRVLHQQVFQNPEMPSRIPVLGATCVDDSTRFPAVRN